MWAQFLKMRIGWSRYYVDVSVAHHWTKWTYSYSCPIKFIFKYKNVDWGGGTCTGLTVCVGEHFFLCWWAYLLSICHRKSRSPIVAGVLGHPDVLRVCNWYHWSPTNHVQIFLSARGKKREFKFFVLIVIAEWMSFYNKMITVALQIIIQLLQYMGYATYNTCWSHRAYLHPFLLCDQLLFVFLLPTTIKFRAVHKLTFFWPSQVTNHKSSEQVNSQVSSKSLVQARYLN